MWIEDQSNVSDMLTKLRRIYETIQLCTKRFETKVRKIVNPLESRVLARLVVTTLIRSRHNFRDSIPTFYNG